MTVDERNEEAVAQETERSLAIAIGTVVGIFAVLAGNVVQASGLTVDADEAEQLLERSDAFGQILAGSIISGLGFVLLGLTLRFLFAAVRRRNSAVAPVYKPLAVVGPALILVSNVLTTFGYDSAASDFAAAGTTSGDEAVELAKQMISDSSVLQVGLFMGLAGVLAFAAGVIYTSLQAMRVGLQTRFWGTLGMAFGVAFLLSMFLGPLGLFGVLVWFLQVGLQPRGKWPGGPLPAWERGVAVPWPDSRSAPPSSEPEPAEPADFEGVATELGPESEPAAGAPPRRRKRKQRD
ncbi:MAG: hypothetical protein KJ006_05055 [Thermoleophilia bacterium]|nr:hypothetical protein [Thermoleophilia bacterium]